MSTALSVENSGAAETSGVTFSQYICHIAKFSSIRSANIVCGYTASMDNNLQTTTPSSKNKCQIRVSSHLLGSSFRVSPLDHSEVMQRGDLLTTGFGVRINSCDCTLRAGELHGNVLLCSHQMLICKQSGVGLHWLTQQHLVGLQARCLHRDIWMHL